MKACPLQIDLYELCSTVLEKSLSTVQLSMVIFKWQGLNSSTSLPICIEPMIWWAENCMEGGRHLDLLSTVMSFYKHLNFNTTFDQVPFFRLWYITPLILMNIKNNYFQFVYTYAVLLLINKNETTNRNATHLSQYPESSLKLIGHFLL